MPRGVQLDLSGKVAVIILESPPANALSEDVISGLSSALDQLERQGCGVVLLTSTLDKYFAAGADLKLLVHLDAEEFGAYLIRLRSVIERLARGSVISIALIEGYALGGGLELALACTFRVATESAKLGLPEIRLGLLPGAGGTQRLTRLIGQSAALDLLLSGEAIGAKRSFDLGLVDRIAPDGGGLEIAETWADRLSSGPRQAQAAIRRCVDAALNGPAQEGMDLEFSEVVNLFATPDGREGVAAFIEKRSASFQTGDENGL